MALTKCSECGSDVSEKAAACPRCGNPIARPVAAQVSHAPAPLPLPRGNNALRNGVLVLLVLAGAGAFTYKFLLKQSTKDTINRVASNTGLTITPWPDRAEAALKAMLRKPGQQDVIGKSIIAITHPTGKFVNVEKYVVRKEGDTLVLELRLAWKGGVLGTAYLTDVRWSCNEKGHVKAEVMQENSAIKTAASNARALDDYFRDTVWPTVRSNAG